MIKYITKRSGNIEPFNAQKVNGWGRWAAEVLGDRVDWPMVVSTALSRVEDQVSSQDLQQALIQVCLEQNSWPYYRLAGRLYGPLLHKKVFGATASDLPHLREVHQRAQDAGLMRTLDYTPEEYDEINAMLDHDRDYDRPHFALHQIRQKYALRDRTGSAEFETPQFTVMRMAMALSEDDPQEERLTHVRNFYEVFSECSLSGPTPNYVNLGTPLAGYASCCTYTTHDNWESLAAGDHIAYAMTVMSAGIGSHVKTRAFGDPVRNGAIRHHGRGPYYRALQAMTKANLQNGRGGAATAYYEFFNPDLPTIARYKNPMSPEDRRIRGIDYAVCINKFLTEKARRKEKMFTFTTYNAPDLYQALYSEDPDEFARLYQQYENDPTFEKHYVDAREYLKIPLNEAVETGRHYTAWMDEINRHTPYKDPIYSSNLCVAPETEILTDKGYVRIDSVAGQNVNVWNGEEFSAVDVVKTGENQELVTVMTDNENVIECTPYHKFYVVDGFGLKAREVRAIDLQAGDKLIKFDFPVIQGEKTLDKAYENGFYSGDGTTSDGNSTQVIYLYGEKRLLADKFEGGSEWKHYPNHGRMIKRYRDLEDKFFVPDVTYCVEDRLKWLAGYADADGSIYRNQGNQQLALVSTNREFLGRVKNMLETVGVGPKIRQVHNGSVAFLPKNDGTGDYGDYPTQPIWRMLINSIDLQKLRSLGFTTNRLEIVDHVPARSAKRFEKVRGVVTYGRRDDTYCFTEPKRHMGVFNGILTGQCTETTFPTAPYDTVADLYSTEDHGRGEIGLCSLGAVVLPNVRDRKHHKKVVYYALRMIDKCIHQAHYALPHLGVTAKRRMNAGVGMMGLAHHMAQAGLTYASPEGKHEFHRIAERHAYLTIEASLELSQELGVAPWMHKTKWPEGWLPVDTYNRNVDSIDTFHHQEDWENLRERIIANGGIRNSSVINYMPGESSSKAIGETNSLYPVRDTTLVKTDDDNTLRWAAPDEDLLTYDIAWDIPTEDMIHMYAIFQKFTDQSISADFYRRIEGTEKVKSSTLLREHFLKTKFGLKTSYYSNSKTSKSRKLEDQGTRQAPTPVPHSPFDENGELVGGDACGDGGCSL